MYLYMATQSRQQLHMYKYVYYNYVYYLPFPFLPMASTMPKSDNFVRPEEACMSHTT